MRIRIALKIVKKKFQKQFRNNKNELIKQHKPDYCNYEFLAKKVNQLIFRNLRREIMSLNQIELLKIK